MAGRYQNLLAANVVLPRWGSVFWGSKRSPNSLAVFEEPLQAIKREEKGKEGREEERKERDGRTTPPPIYFGHGLSRRGCMKELQMSFFPALGANSAL